MSSWCCKWCCQLLLWLAHPTSDVPIAVLNSLSSSSKVLTHCSRGIFVATCGIFSCGMWTLSCGMWDLVPQPGMEPRPPALGARSLSHWITRGVPQSHSWFLPFLHLKHSGHQQVLWQIFWISWFLFLHFIALIQDTITLFWDYFHNFLVGLPASALSP